MKEKVLAELDTVEKDEHDRFPLHKLESLPYFVSSRSQTPLPRNLAN